MEKTDKVGESMQGSFMWNTIAFFSSSALFLNSIVLLSNFVCQAEDGIRDYTVTGVQTCALPICDAAHEGRMRGDDVADGWDVGAVQRAHEDGLRGPFGCRAFGRMRHGGQGPALAVDPAPAKAWRAPAQAQAGDQVGAAQHLHQVRGVADGAVLQAGQLDDEGSGHGGSGSSNGDFDVPVIRASLLAWLLVPLSRTTKMLHTSAETKPSSSPRTGLRSIALAGLLACGLPLAASAQGLDAQGLAALDTAIQPLAPRSEEHTSELQSPCNLVCRLLLEKKKVH